jgi:hypothetical protein
VSNIDARVARISAARLIFEIPEACAARIVLDHARFQLRGDILVVRDPAKNFVTIKFAAVGQALRCNRTKQVTSS